MQTDGLSTATQLGAMWRKSSHSGPNGGACVEVASLVPVWRKSSRSGSGGGQCLEVANLSAIWRKSSHSGPNGGECVEIASLAGPVGVRDSKNPTGPALVFDTAAWASFVRSTRSGRLDLPGAQV
ncbi:protein of unknown function (DUF397) [Streptoalloteichus tenebrarius]|uniref:DUF397 domain-containing protein n=1 Tax=Streptoalloteichus tenebrarius (strain ATCC 17920 / DSM 40477 / JCM 4838 / CBS 697.72 / NBRC 16177 / NCIMB 11028 / NRRL B-12390 / A12253. 1 / ISP 5477) TaxID=1933 RepID=A0ABT1I2G7_STRSD|nr:DUF397 domain-containing protein [Streptoalloteichus tenebrarius]MCP2261990.1 protein of unknown function (DUF397) [Streptoalloteichus tenebrarius]BFF02109.1 hypothetical protein GCM10020241_37840 [Streptoalloteichus tenebrarius]